MNSVNYVQISFKMRVYNTDTDRLQNIYVNVKGYHKLYGQINITKLKKKRVSRPYYARFDDEWDFQHKIILRK